MGLSYVGSSLVSRSEVDEAFGAEEHHAYMAVARRAVPAWARMHDEFAGAAHLAIVEVLSSFDPGAGVPIESFLYIRARSRIPTLLARADRHKDMLVPLDDPTGEDGRCIPGLVENDEEAWEDRVVSASCLREFLMRLSPRQRDVARLIIGGARQQEIARTLGVSLSAVCNCLRSMRPKAGAYYGIRPSTSRITVAA
jgi:RNA polymerase sigma factor (sigma-70 family)